VKAVILPDGTQVLAGALGGQRSAPPDFGLYVYGRAKRRPSSFGRLINLITGRALHAGSWTSPWDADWIHWPDFGVPMDGEAAARSIVGAFERARRGETVEVACYGGNGRTGTILACMSVLSGLPGDAAVEWVRANYSGRAVERAAQRRWVEWFASSSASPWTSSGGSSSAGAKPKTWP
jgi:hypothetical protein